MDKTKSKNKNYFLEGLLKVSKHFLSVFNEIRLGILNQSIDWTFCGIYFSAIVALVISDLDLLFYNYFEILWLYPKSQYFFWSFYIFIGLTGFYVWGLREYYRRKSLTDQLKSAFLNAGLKDAQGRLPSIISDHAVDEHTRKLHLLSKGIPLKKFEEQVDYLEANLKIYIDEVKEKRSTGTVDILYSHIPMPEMVESKKLKKQSNFKYLVGSTRAKLVTNDFRASPHLLIAGQTGGGKSTFLRQLITNLYLSNPSVKFNLIDLKGGLEFQTFRNTERIKVIESIESVSDKLGEIEKELDRRMGLIKSKKAKDIDAYQKIVVKESKKSSETDADTPKGLHREFIVIDEAAELFLVNHLVDTASAQKIRKSVSRLARLGRACGLHLIIATQRPDAKAIDSQVKSNLTSIVCFQMPNLASSMTVLSNGRAQHLPPIQGRAIYRNGSTQVEIQTPFMSEDEAEAALEPFRHEESEKVNAIEDQNSVNKKVVTTSGSLRDD